MLSISSVYSDFSSIFGEILTEYSPLILGPVLSTIFGSIFDLFLDSARSVSCLFYCAFSISIAVLAPLLDRFCTVYFITRRFVSLLGMFHLSRGRVSSQGGMYLVFQV
jgi:hypothetical protein